MAVNFARRWLKRAQLYLRRDGGRARRRPTRLALETLEPRLAPASQLSIADASVVSPAGSGSASMVFTVTRTGDLSGQLTVGFTTVADTAEAGSDFTATTGTTTFASGAATATISIPVFGNGTFDQPSLSFSVQLTGIVNVVGPPVALAGPDGFTVGTNPSAVATGDFNADGRLDLAVANRGDNDVSVRLNTTAPGAATPTFSGPTDFAASTQPSAVAVGDLNGDGRPDLVVANAGFDSVSVLLNTTPLEEATPTFAAKQDFATGAAPNAVAIGDLNGDGRLDLALTNENAATVTVLLNATAAGAVSFSFPIRSDFDTGTTPATTHPADVVIADFNGDGLADLAVANNGDNNVSVLRNLTTPGNGVPSFAPRQDFSVGSQPVALVSRDFNGDGRPDLAVANADSTLSVRLNTTAPGAILFSFAAGVSFATENSPADVAAGDLNNDGKTDLIVAASGGSAASVLVNATAPGASVPSFAAQDFATGSPVAVAVADFNGDGRLDLAAANPGAPSVDVLLNATLLAGTSPEFPSAATPAVGSGPMAVAAGDLNGDGRRDLVVANLNDDTLSVLRNFTAPGGAPAFAVQQTFATGTSPSAVALGDLNGDGRDDIVVANAGSNNVSVLFNATAPGGVFSFLPQQLFGAGASPSAVALGDINRDGLDDVVVANLGSHTVSVLLNMTAPGAATPAFADAQAFFAGNDPAALVLTDLDRDGAPDLVVANQLDNTLTLLFNTTAPGAALASFLLNSVPTGASPGAIAVGDIDGDGATDIVVANGGDDTVLALLNNGNSQAFPAGASPSAVALGDVDGDGRADIMVANAADNTVSLLLSTTAPGADDPSFAPQQTFATGLFPRALVLADITGEGLSDLVLANLTDETASVLPNRRALIADDEALGTIIDPQPVLTLSAAAAVYRTGGPPVRIDAGASVVDLDSTNFAGGTLTVTLVAPHRAGTDRLAVNHQGTGPGQIGVAGSAITFGSATIATFTGGVGTAPLVLTFTSAATPARARALLRNLTFFSTSSSPATFSRSVQLVLDDGAGQSSAPVTKTVTVIARNPALVGSFADGNFALQHRDADHSFGAATDVPLAGDWNGDGKVDIGVYRPSTARFFLDSNGNDRFDAASDAQFGFGAFNDIPITGDWNGDGFTDIGVWRPSQTRFFLDSNGNRAFGAGDAQFPFGIANDLPVTGDWDGDGITNIGIWRPSTTRFHLDLDDDRVFEETDAQFAFGASSDRPVTGDWNGDGRTDVGVWRPSSATYFLDFNANHRFDAAGDQVFAFGAATDQPLTGDWNGDGRADVGRVASAIFTLDLDSDHRIAVNTAFAFMTFQAGDLPLVGDWNGDGRDDIGIWRNRVFYLDLNGDRLYTAGVDGAFAFGIASDIPVTGDWNGDGKTDIGIWRPSQARFYLDTSGNRVYDPGVDGQFNFGATTDVPVTGDWNGDGITDIGVWRPSLARFFLDSNGNRVFNAASDAQFVYGMTSDLPVAGDWNGDGVSDVGIWRPSELRFYLDSNGNRLLDGTDLQVLFGSAASKPISGRWYNLP